MNGYLAWRNLQLNHVLHVVTFKDYLFLTHFAVNAKAVLCSSERDTVRKGLDER